MLVSGQIVQTDDDINKMKYCVARKIIFACGKRQNKNKICCPEKTNNSPCAAEKACNKQIKKDTCVKRKTVYRSDFVETREPL